jgi:predicted nucleic acid-binding protein
MSVLVDTGVLYAAFDRAASRHDTAQGALRTVLTEASYGQVVTTEYVYDETVTLTAERTNSTQRAIELGRRLLSSDGEWGQAVEVRLVGRAVFEEAADAFERYDDHGLSFTDATTTAFAERERVDGVLSFDDDFDGVVERLEPGSVVD